MVTKKRLANLPNIVALKNLCQSLAVLDAILCPEWEYRYFSFNSKWSEGEMMASMRNGSGDEYFILFNPHGAIIKGFAHESSMSPWASGTNQVWPGVLDQVPSEFQAFLSEPAFSVSETTFCIWRRVEDDSWLTGHIEYPEGEDSDGSEELLFALDGDPKSYQEFAEEYYERAVDFGSVTAICEHRPLIRNCQAIESRRLPGIIKVRCGGDRLPSCSNLTNVWKGVALRGGNFHRWSQ